MFCSDGEADRCELLLIDPSLSRSRAPGRYVSYSSSAFFLAMLAAERRAEYGKSGRTVLTMVNHS